MEYIHVTSASDTIEADEFAIPSTDENTQKLGNTLLNPKPEIVTDVMPIDGPEVGNIEIMTGT
jgi:hypothetical protein